MHAVIYIYLLNGGNFHRKLFKLIYIFVSYQFLNLSRAPKKAKNNVWKRDTLAEYSQTLKMIISIM